MRILPKLDANEEPIHGRFIRHLAAKPYRTKLERGSIDLLPVDFARREKAEAKRARKAAVRRSA